MNPFRRIVLGGLCGSLALTAVYAAESAAAGSMRIMTYACVFVALFLGIVAVFLVGRGVSDL